MDSGALPEGHLRRGPSGVATPTSRMSSPRYSDHGVGARGGPTPIARVLSGKGLGGQSEGVAASSADDVLYKVSLSPKAGTLSREGSGNTDECRICKEDAGTERMIRPCECGGSMARVHLVCLKQWIEKRRQDMEETEALKCEVCKSPYRLHVKEVFDFKSVFSCASMGFYAEFFTILATLISMVALFYLFSKSESEQTAIGSLPFYVSLVMGIVVLGLGLFTLFKVSIRWRRANSVPVITPMSPRSPRVTAV